MRERLLVKYLNIIIKYSPKSVKYQIRKHWDIRLMKNLLFYHFNYRMDKHSLNFKSENFKREDDLEFKGKMIRD